MRNARTTLIWSVELIFVGGLPAANGAAPQPKPKPKPRAGRARLLEIPKVSKDQVICFALYTANDSILKLTAQLYPLEDGDPRTVRLEVKQDGEWQQIVTTEVVNPGWTDKTTRNMPTSSGILGHEPPWLPCFQGFDGYFGNNIGSGWRAPT
jgi:hypothetical protein